MSSEDEVNRFMVHGVAKTDYLFWENKQKVSRGELMGSIASLQAQNAQLQQHNAQLQQYNTQLQQNNAVLQRRHDDCYDAYVQYVKYGEDLNNEIREFKKKLIKKQEWYTKVFNQQKYHYNEITAKLEKYKTANDKMYKMLDLIKKISYGDRYQQISDTLDEVDKLVTPVSRVNTQETPNKL
jgi:DNA repair exonuclease SbcCD ATPase subunit